MTVNRRTFKNQEDAVAYVKELSGFYRQVLVYAVVNVFFILYWLLSGEDYFWPIWVILGWGTPLFFVAVDLQILPKSVQKTMNSILESLPLPFLKPEWETDQLNRIYKKKNVKSEESSLVLTKAMASKATVKKVPPSAEKVKTIAASVKSKKTAPKKVASKKASLKTPKK